MPVVPWLVKTKNPAFYGAGGFSQHLIYIFPPYWLDGITDGHSQWGLRDT